MSLIDKNNRDSTRNHLWSGGIAGLIVGGVILYFLNEWGSWLPDITFKKILICLSRETMEQRTYPELKIYIGLIFSSFLIVLLHPGYAKASIAGWILHNEPSAKNCFRYIVCALILNCILQYILSCYVTLSAIHTIKHILYIMTLLATGGMLLYDAWQQSQLNDTTLNQLRLAVLITIALQAIWPVNLLIFSAQTYDNMAMGLSIAAALMLGALLAFLATAGLTCLVRLLLGKKNLRAWRPQFALFNGIIILCVAGSYLFNMIFH